MIRWIIGVSLKDKKNSEVDVGLYTDKVREAGLRCFGHVERNAENNARQIIDVNVPITKQRQTQEDRWTRHKIYKNS